MKRRYRRTTGTTILACIVFCVATAASYGQTATGPYVAFTGAIPLQPDDLIGNAAFGGQIGFRGPGGFLLLGEYLYAGKDFYFYDGSSWKMAASWLDLPSGSSSRGDWLFYRERHVVGLAAGFAGAFGQVGVFGAGGIMFNVVTLPEATDYYPEFEEAATRSSIGNSSVLFTTSLRAGVVYPARSPVAGHVAVLAQLEPSEQLGETRYYRRNTMFLVGMAFQIGPLLGGGAQ